MAEKVINGFMKGMSKDLHYSLLDNQKYVHSENFRPVSSGFSTTGAIENIKGNKFIGDSAFTNTTPLIDGHIYLVVADTIIYNAVTYLIYSTFTCETANGLAFTGTGRVIDITSYTIPEDMYIVGGVEVRDEIVLFTTNIMDPGISSYGLLYNKYAILDSRGLAPEGYHIPSQSEWEELSTYLGGAQATAEAITLPGNYSYWELPYNTGATNSSEFSAIGTGYRTQLGPFAQFNRLSVFASTDSTSAFLSYSFFDNNISLVTNATFNNTDGISVRCVRDSNIGWTSGDTVSDYDGNVYDTIQIGTQIWTKQNLAVTHYKNGSLIPEIIDDIDWASSIEGSFAPYDNNWNNVYSMMPTIKNSKIYKLKLSGTSNSEINTLELLYDDSLNVDNSTLDFDINNPIKAVSRYESPSIQKVYWTDGINPIRYINVSEPSTITGEVYVNDGDYWGVDKFEFLPEVKLNKPTITGITTGTIPTGVVFYAYQLYIENGAESAISYISDPAHVVADSDYYANDLYYKGDGVDSVKSKGFIVNIDFSGNNSYNRLKLLRIHYGSYNQVPAVYIAADIPIDLINNTNITLTDVGAIVGEMTVDEFNIASSEIFICQELATKANILFAGNIEKKTFEIDDFDARAVRFKNYTEELAGTDYITTQVYDSSPEDSEDYITTIYWGPNSIYLSISNFKEWAAIPVDRTISTVTALANKLHFKYMYGLNTYTITSANITFINPVWNGTEFVSEITSPDIIFIGTPVVLTECTISNTVVGGTIFEYTYTSTGATTILSKVSDITHGYGDLTILVPSDTSDPTSWDTAGWHNYHEDHDGINNYNNPDNDTDSNETYIYQSDSFTLGAEGPNITIGFDYDDFVIDEVATTPQTYYVGTEADGSYKNYSSPLNLGKLSWQRDEVYRLFIIFKNKRGQDTDPKWITDLRFPALRESTYGVLTDTSGTTTTARRIYPTIKIKDNTWPTDAISAQVYRVIRGKEDKQIVTQCLAYPFEYVDNGWYLATATDNLDTYTSGNENLIKLVSPEINITKNVSQSGNDYLEYITKYSSIDVGALTNGYNRRIVKCTENTPSSAITANDRSDINDVISIIAIDGDPVTFSVGGTSFYNYNDSAYINAKGSTGLVIKYSNNSWSAEDKVLAVVNYKNNCWTSQYGGLTYENRQFNNMLPCSDIIYEEDTTYNCEYGDTFITYFDVATLLYDPAIAEGETSFYSKNESVYIPLESSINCNLRVGAYQMHKQYGAVNSYLMQEELGVHMYTNNVPTLVVYNQTDDMYKYNTVYSQQPLIASRISIDTTRSNETVFDTQVRASNVKINGEYIDSWTRFGVNETIDVDSRYGPLNAMLEYGQSLYFWQDEAFGVLAVNDRSLIQDNNSAKLSLGTGGVLDRFDYISTQKGCEDKFSVVAGVAGVYWVDRRSLSINRFAESLADLALQKEVKSLFTIDADIATWPKYMSVQDKTNNEVLFTLANYEDGVISNPGITEVSLNRPFTLCFSETMDCFTSEYTFKPYIYIPYNNTFLSATTHNSLYITSPYPSNLLFVHNVDDTIQARNNFYGLYYNDALGRHRSKLRTVFNPYYLNTKVFDNMFYNGDIKLCTNASDTYKRDINETFDNELSPIHSVLFYNDYQTTGNHVLTYKTNLERRERTWQTIIPRNDVEALYNAQYLHPSIEDLSGDGTSYPERMRDKYLICEIDTKYSTNNTNSYRVIIENLGVTYRNSYR